MRNAKAYLGVTLTGSILFFLASVPLASSSVSFLKGKVYDLSAENLKLEQKFGLATKRHLANEKSTAYFTGYSFIGKKNFHMGECYSKSELFQVAAEGKEIRFHKRSKYKSGKISDSEEGSNPVGVLFLHILSKKKGKIVDTRLIDLDNRYEFEDIPIYWLGETDNSQSLSFLKKQFEAENLSLQKSLLFLIYYHDHPGSLEFLHEVASGKYAKKIRKEAIFWIGTEKNAKSLGVLKELYAKEKDYDLKKQVIFSMQLSHQKEAAQELIKIARTEENLNLRKNAIFWLGQKASQEAAKALKDVVDNEADLDLKKQAVFAISQLPKEKSVPMLIEIAKTNKSLSVRKNAIFWLGQSGDEEALQFFEEILSGKKH